MTTTTGLRASRNGEGGYPAGRTGAGVGGGLPTRQRRPGYLALALILILGTAALGMNLYSQAGKKTPVVVVVREIAAGHVIDRSDLSVVRVAGQVTAIGAEHLDSVLGQTAAVDLLPNTLLQRAMVTSAAALAAGRSMVGVQLKPGQLPSDGLADGVTVQVLQLPNKDTTAGPGPAVVLASAAQVFSSTPDPSQSGGTLLTLLVPASAAAAIAAASNAGLVALVQVSQ